MPLFADEIAFKFCKYFGILDHGDCIASFCGDVKKLKITGSPIKIMGSGLVFCLAFSDQLKEVGDYVGLHYSRVSSVAKNKT